MRTQHLLINNHDSHTLGTLHARHVTKLALQFGICHHLPIDSERDYLLCCCVWSDNVDVDKTRLPDASPQPDLTLTSASLLPKSPPRFSCLQYKKAGKAWYVHVVTCDIQWNLFTMDTWDQPFLGHFCR